MNPERLRHRAEIELLLTEGRKGEGVFGHIGLTVYLLRQLKGMSQRDLATRAGFSVSQVSKYETGNCLPNLPSLERLLAALDLSPLAFFYANHFIEELSDAFARGKAAPGAAKPSRKSLERIFQQTITNLLTLYRGLVVLP